MPPNEGKAPLSEAARDPEVDLQPKQRRIDLRSRKYRIRWLFGVLLSFVFFGLFAGLILVISNPEVTGPGDADGAPQPTSQPTTTQAPRTPTAVATAEPPDIVASADPDADDSSDEGPLSGTWSMWWRNAADSDSVAFTLRFNGLNTGTVEVLNDDTASDASFTLEDDVLSFRFTRMFEPPPKWPEDNPYEGWPETSTFEGTRVSDGQFLGTWFRDDWECRPERQPPCVTKPEPNDYTSWLERES